MAKQFDDVLEKKVDPKKEYHKKYSEEREESDEDGDITAIYEIFARIKMDFEVCKIDSETIALKKRGRF